jgi:dodecin
VLLPGNEGIVSGRASNEEVCRMAVARVTEISSTSTVGFEDAVKTGLDRATQTLRNVKRAWIKEQHVRLDDGTITEYQVNMLVTFVLDE